MTSVVMETKEDGREGRVLTSYPVWEGMGLNTVIPSSAGSSVWTQAESVCLFCVVLCRSNSISVFHGCYMMYEMRSRKSTLLQTRGVFNLPHHIVPLIYERNWPLMTL